MNNFITILTDFDKGVRSIESSKSYPTHLKKINNLNENLLDFKLRLINSLNLKEIYFVGSYHIEKVINNYTQFKYIYFDERYNENFLSIIEKINTNNKSVLIINKNFLFKKKLIDHILKNKKKNFFLFNKNNPNINDALIYINNSSIKKIKKNISSLKKIKDLLLIKKKLNKIINFNNIKNETLFSFYEDDFSIAKFIFGTKAQTLETISSHVKSSIILDQITIDYGQWIKNKNSILNKISNKFKNKKIIIRSSSLQEDTWSTSMAGYFESYSNVSSNDKSLINENIEKLFDSYVVNSKIDNKNEVLVQEYIINSKVSGVVFTSLIESGSPYFFINYDDQTGRSDTITSGSTNKVKNLFLYKKSKIKFRHKWLNNLLKSIKEIEKITNHNCLDIEFLINKKNKVYILQTRPLIINNQLKFKREEDLEKELLSINKYLNVILKRDTLLFGNNNFLSNMSDWNPAEMIGFQPSPLARSIYKELITDKTWATAREKLGYKALKKTNLMISIAGKEFIDLRKSFNSFLIKNLPKNLCDELVSKEINFLKKKPYLADKVEFEVCINVYNLDKENLKNHLNKNLKISKKKTNFIIDEYRKWTLNLVNESDFYFKNLDEKYKELNKFLKVFKIKNQHNIEQLINELLNIVEFTKELASIPFSIDARCGFVSLTFLKTLLRKKIFNEKEYSKFLNNIPTISFLFNQKINLVSKNVNNYEDFINLFGHLRPSTYDIESKNYTELFPKKVFRGKKTNLISNKIDLDISKKLWESKKTKIIRLLKESKFNIKHEKLFNFIVQGIQRREKGKYEYSKSVNIIIILVEKIAKLIGIEKRKFKYIDLLELIELSSKNISSFEIIKRQINFREKKYQFDQLISLPHHIAKTGDIYSFHNIENEPNFITNKKTNGEIIKITIDQKIKNIKDKIVLIESADPGYDWIFSYNIKGLITKFGGAASHMSIRASEYSLPAAIGVGEEKFKKLSQSKNVFLDCLNKKINII